MLEKAEKPNIMQYMLDFKLMQFSGGRGHNLFHNILPTTT